MWSRINKKNFNVKKDSKSIPRYRKSLQLGTKGTAIKNRLQNEVRYALKPAIIRIIQAECQIARKQKGKNNYIST